MESLQKYVQLFLESYQHCTHIAIWDKEGAMYAATGKGQDYLCQKTLSVPKLNAFALEPYYLSGSWMDALENKRILIIHPFAESMQSQINHFAAIFPDRPWFKGCTFQFVKPPVTLAGNHENRDWQDHLNDCIQRLNAVADYDIALIGAGGYGMLLSNYIYSTRKSVMYIGGALQLFFGIIGKRWFKNKRILDIMTDDWIRPPSSEKPLNFTKVEQGCYW